MGVVDEEDGEAGHTAPSLQQVGGQINEAMTVMQDNMRAMAERESQLSNLEGKSDALQGASSGFAKGAKRLHDQQKWQRYRLYIAIIGTIIWIVALVMFRRHLVSFLVLTGVLAVAAYFGSSYLWPPVDLEGGQTQLVRTSLE
mmetsp:Transcript_123077/g.245009  ORF Transcript_123077/g.245009 Transcript_123077/m.245009 type:complete len:143 (-) Transcript_123077:64-492(-)|eukprot:CAMPEP_0172712486 /NCGR_PEP_ID=MMETSP1074-20121228/61128_1 /TAXON_ID=2916 /ORGANISM="Ceratium fusus, Strain PA161109" /LENGTH=142 /DNA_ID=CAMNT_0013536419 /DNA_START=122 /DNA_END=550 /DNA_ORIENTATION=-